MKSTAGWISGWLPSNYTSIDTIRLYGKHRKSGVDRIGYGCIQGQGDADMDQYSGFETVITSVMGDEPTEIANGTRAVGVPAKIVEVDLIK